MENKYQNEESSSALGEVMIECECDGPCDHSGTPPKKEDTVNEPGHGDHQPNTSSSGGHLSTGNSSVVSGNIHTDTDMQLEQDLQSTLPDDDSNPSQDDLACLLQQQAKWNASRRESDEESDSLRMGSNSDDLLSELDFPERHDASIFSRKSKSLASQSRLKSGSLNNVPSAERVRSRGRPLKPHEREPFLSIDNLPGNKKVVNSHQVSVSPNNNNQPASQSPLVTKQINIMTSSGCSSDWNKLVPRQTRPCRGDGCVSTAVAPQIQKPFKHAVGTKKKMNQTPSPSQHMKDQTVQATYHVARSLAKHTPPKEVRIQGRLLKARLQPMQPVLVQGPGMEHCRGVVAGSKRSKPPRLQRNINSATQLPADNIPQSWLEATRSHGASTSRTLERRRHLMSMLARDHGYERPSTRESIHQTSVASDLSDREQDLKTPEPTRNTDVKANESGQELSSAQPEIHEDDSTPLVSNGDVRKLRGIMTPDEQGRPCTGADGQSRKAVRFAGDMNVGSNSGSAESRKSNRSPTGGSSKKKSRNTCRPQTQDSGHSHDDGDEEHKDNSDSTTLRLSGTAGSQPGSDSSQAVQNTQNSSGQSENNGGGNQRNVASMPVNSLMEGFCEPESIVRPTTPCGRPSSRTGWWEDTVKPDDDVTDLNLAGAGFMNDKEEEKVPPSSVKKRKPKDVQMLRKPIVGSGAQHAFGVKQRPQSAGPREYIQKKTDESKKKRPSSAKTLTVQFNDLVLCEPQKNSCYPPRKLQAQPAVVKQQSPLSHRENGLISVQGTAMYTSVGCTSCGKSMSRMKEKVESEEDRQNVCLSCMRSTSDTACGPDVTTGCSSDSDTQEVNDVPEEAVHTQDADIETRDGKGEACCDEKVSGTVENDSLSGFNDLSDTLDQIQQEIHSTTDKTVAESLDLQLESYDSHRQNDNSSDSDKCSSTAEVKSDATTEVNEGQMSAVLTGDAEDCNMTVYSFQEKQVTRKNSVTGSKGDLSSEKRKGCQDAYGNINTHGVKMVSDPLAVSLNNAINSSERESNINEQLTVVASSSLLHRTKPEESKPLAPMAPLCFRVNARPPEGFLYYFAYGMDMNISRLSTYIGRTVTNRYWGILYGFQLMFNKTGVSNEAGGSPNLSPNSRSSVEGCLYLMSPADLTALDGCMGYPWDCVHIVVPVWLLNCEESTDLGVAQYCVPAVAYVAKDHRTHTNGGQLSNSYAVDQCVKGADGLLSPEYTKHLQGLRYEIAAAEA